MRKLLLYLFLSLGLPTLVLSQNKSRELLDKAKKISLSNTDSSFLLCVEAEKLNNPKLSGEIALCKGRHFLRVADYEHCEIELTKAINFFEKNKNFDQLASAYSLKSLFSERIGDTELEKKYLIKAYELDKISGNKDNLINRLFNLIFLNSKYRNIEKTKFYLDELEKYKQFFDQQDWYFYYQDNALYLLLIKDNDRAIENLQEALHVAETNRMVDSKATTLVLFAKAYKNKKNYAEAEKYALESYHFSKANKLIYEESEALEELISLEELQQKFKEAFFFQKELKNISKQILDSEKLNRIKAFNEKLARIQNDQIIEKKNLKIEQQKSQNIEIKSKSDFLSLILGFSILTLIIITFVFIRTKKLNRIIEKQKALVDEKNQEITDSITYAKRIQSAILPNPKLMKEHFRDSFICYKPKDIVAGDFYWFEVIDNLIFFAAADCTGHGVPGAMVSVVCNNALNRSVKEYNLKLPNEILNKTRDLIISEFEKSDEDVKDGMDISLCVFDKKTNRMHWSGAHNPLWILRNEEIIEYKADKQPIGKFSYAKDFTLHEIEMLAQDEIYIFTDGLQDQFGGEKGKKFKASQLKGLLIQLGSQSMDAKQVSLEAAFNAWKGELQQVDDVCVIGIKF